MSGSTKRTSRLLAMHLACVAIVASLLALPPQSHAQEEASLSITSAIESSVINIRASHMTKDSMAGKFYFAQGGSGRCTITSIAMMIKRAAYLDGVPEWEDIGAESVSADGWCAAGVKNEFDTAGYHVSITGITGSAESLKSLLAQHPEGVAIYDAGVPHAVLLTDYDEKSDTFFCADPANYYSGKRIPLSQSWNGERHGKDQQSTIAGFSQAWVITRSA